MNRRPAGPGGCLTRAHGWGACSGRWAGCRVQRRRPPLDASRKEGVYIKKGRRWGEGATRGEEGEGRRGAEEKAGVLARRAAACLAPAGTQLARLHGRAARPWGRRAAARRPRGACWGGEIREPPLQGGCGGWALPHGLRARTQNWGWELGGFGGRIDDVRIARADLAAAAASVEQLLQHAGALNAGADVGRVVGDGALRRRGAGSTGGRAHRGRGGQRAHVERGIGLRLRVRSQADSLGERESVITRSEGCGGRPEPLGGAGTASTRVRAQSVREHSAARRLPGVQLPPYSAPGPVRPHRWRGRPRGHGGRRAGPWLRA